MFGFFEWSVANDLDEIVLSIEEESTVSSNTERFILKTLNFQLVPMYLIMSSILMWRDVENVSNEIANDQNIN
jgi:hypothetical protein